MSQSQLSKKFYHRVVDFLMPNNCRAKLENAFAENKRACSDLLSYIDKNEHNLVAALKTDRRAKERHG